MKQCFLTSHGWHIISASLLISLWLVTLAILEYALTEWRFVYINIPEYWQATVFMIILFVIGVTATHITKKHPQPSAAIFVATVVLMILSIIGYTKYLQYQDWLQTFPKIRSVSKKWSIQGDRIAIMGKNFGEPWRSGSVYVGNIEYTIVSWTPTKILIEQPVTGQYGTKPLVIYNHHNKYAELKEFEIKDPSQVLK
ncbi:MAG: IPT/TIG domain-containing protein [Patescibacteria group bacterium]|nr:IPT/TIG domain-containing protein [Patescibacteria group bacterium]